MSGKELYELKVVAPEEEARPEVPAAPVAVSPGFSELLSQAQEDASMDQPENQQLRASWKQTQRELDSLTEKSQGRLEIQNQIVEAAEKAEVRLGQVESHAEEIRRVARLQAESVLEAAREEAGRLQEDTRDSLESAMANVLKQTSDSRARAAELSRLAAEDAQARVREASQEAEPADSPGSRNRGAADGLLSCPGRRADETRSPAALS